ncbi:MAG: type II 3-dehydroquinate dehydratase [Gracilimonas sp.]|uniref:type II 3-dehydroquinate dehydratase n=1 Tax=Gracilimonas TaxID=649462 RepID=UPI001B14C6DB|nr:type II 3-dehydroquinate dehydratase [Gracilimonas sp.]MBO6584978.1 type II 3-dehydroquinate dehydratase [Gracilimonas sp.]MBO6615751.1 type II 3-dehydroquinate dehydratase [Gracilimonas sp.]
MNILIINGPNLNLLGKRNPGIYGAKSLKDLEYFLIDEFPKHNLDFFQSNIEGELIDQVQQAMESDLHGIVINPGGYSHTSVALRDALEPLGIPKVEVHISNIHAREEFREKSITGGVMDGIITGFGKYSYVLGIQALENMTE